MSKKIESEVVTAEVVTSKKYSSANRGRIVNVNMNGETYKSLTQAILKMKEGWTNKDKEAIKMWQSVNAKLTKTGIATIEFDNAKFDFKLIIE